MQNLVPMKLVDLKDALGVSANALRTFCMRHDLSTPIEGGRKKGRTLLSSEVRRLLELRGYKYPKQATICAFTMCKGGVGKSTSAYFLAKRLHDYGCRILVVDADPQGNLTSAFHLENIDIKIDAETGVLADVFSKETTLDDVIINIDDGLDLLPSTPMNSNAETVLRNSVVNPSKPLKKILDPVSNRYDYILIDCAPTLNLMNTVIMLTSERIIVPVNPDPFSKMGLSQTLDEIDTVHEDFPDWQPDTKILFTKYDSREYTSLKFLSDMASSYDEKLFTTTIRTSTQFKNAIDKNIDLFSQNSPAKTDYDHLAQEFLNLSEIVKSNIN